MRLPPPPRLRPRGSPLLTLVLVLGGWVVLRAATWQDPFAPVSGTAPSGPTPFPAPAPRSVADPFVPAALASPGAAAGAQAPRLPAPRRALSPARGAPLPETRLVPLPAPQPAQVLPTASAPGGEDRGPPQPAPAPFATARSPAPGRWSLDTWGFWRDGSGAAAVSQGRVPIYGASQAGAVLQYRLAPASGHDPRLYARAYRALVTRGESELAIGGSLRPLPQVPVRLAGEARYTDSPFGSEVRPAGYAVTEIDPVPLPLGTRLELYGQAGWVGGRGRTAFADGQASITGALPFAGRLSKDALRLSLGAGAWGGAQQGAQRLDVGPTLRLDMKLARTPARLSVDWRARVAGDAAPGSGVAATLSAGF